MRVGMTETNYNYISSELYDVLMDHKNCGGICEHFTKCEATAIVMATMQLETLSEFRICKRNCLYSEKLEYKEGKLFLCIKNGEIEEEIELVPCDSYKGDAAEYECEECRNCERFKHKEVNCGETREREPIPGESNHRLDGSWDFDTPKEIIRQLELIRKDYNKRKGANGNRPRFSNLVAFGAAYFDYFETWQKKFPGNNSFIDGCGIDDDKTLMNIYRQVKHRNRDAWNKMTARNKYQLVNNVAHIGGILKHRGQPIA
jgi:hypothetical protein